MANPTARALAGRPAAALLDLANVRRMVDVLETRCREPSWPRVAVATLERFRRVTKGNLNELLDGSLADVLLAEHALLRYADAMAEHGPSHVSALSLGPKLWFRTNGVPVPWRPLRATQPDRITVFAERDPGTLLLLTAMIGSGLSAGEVMALRVRDLGSLDHGGQLLPDPSADPLAVRYRPDGGTGNRVTFLSDVARSVWLASVAGRGLAGRVDPAAPFVAAPDSPTGREILARAAARHAALIAAGNDANVHTCRLTGDFFRQWGMPGQRYEERHRTGAAITPETSTRLAGAARR